MKQRRGAMQQRLAVLIELGLVSVAGESHERDDQLALVLSTLAHVIYRLAEKTLDLLLGKNLQKIRKFALPIADQGMELVEIVSLLSFPPIEPTCTGTFAQTLQTVHLFFVSVDCVFAA
ncbi:hypothetical protein TKK_0003948 [Trichogramma kaykai]